MKTIRQILRCNLILCSILILFLTNTINAQDTHLWGVTNTGGENGYGTLYRTDLNGENYSQIHSFNKVFCSMPASVQLVYAQDGLMYGTTQWGDASVYGTIFSYNPTTGALERKYVFEGGPQGTEPRGGLVLANNDLLYGTTTFGGNYDFGILYSYDPSNGIFTKVFDFDGVNNGSLPHNRLLAASNGKLYGMAHSGGVNDQGTLFSFSPSTNIFSKILDFDGSNGANPFGNLMQASNGLIYGMTSSGGISSIFGCIFTLNPSTEEYSVKKNIIISSGKFPYGGLIETSEGHLWGTTTDGGNNDKGIIFSYDPVQNNFNAVIHLDQAIGTIPNGDLTELNNGLLYGLAQKGGATDNGVLFSVNPITNNYTVNHEFDGANDGGDLLGSLASSTNNHLVGVTHYGGFGNNGTLFDYNTSTNIFTKISDLFNSNPFGLNPNDLIVRHDLARSRFPNLDPMYGTTKDGGQFDDGGIYSYNPVSNTLALKASFNNNTTGREPSTITSSENGKFYGTTKLGGTNNYGTLFEYDPMTESLSALINFDATVIGGDSKGKILEADNGLLYGTTTTTGGSLGNGTLFSYDPTNQQLTKIIDFENSLGFSAKATLIQSNNGFIYGLCQGGGQYANGTIFKLDTNTNSVSKVADFNSEGKFPQVLVQGDNGLLYGIAQQSGNSDVGTIFEFDPSQNSLVKIHNFEAAASGAYPTGIMYNGEGKLVGTTQSGGNDDKGTVFEYDLNANNFQVTHHFNGTNGEFPNMQSLQKLDDSLIGIDDYFDTQSAIVLYPNPVDDIFFLNGYEANQKFAIYNLLGQKVQEGIIKPEKPIKVENLKSGIYILKLDDGRSIKLLKK